MKSEELQELLADVDWLRALARRLARDDHLAEDLVQDTCEIALRKDAPPQHWRSWLVGVMRTLFLVQRRRGAQRQRTLALVPRRDASEGVVDVVQRAEVHRMLVSAVLQLEEPYRSTVLLRFFENLPPRDIAARQGLPVATVHSRLQRALLQLRGRLDHEAGSRANWLVLAMPFAWPEGVVPAHSVARTVRRAWVAAGVLVCAGIAVLATWNDGGPAVVAPNGRDERVVRELSQQPGAASERVLPADLAATTSPALAALRRVRGRVHDCNGVGLPGLAITAVLGETPSAAVAGASIRPRFAVSGGDGVFEGLLDADAAFLLVASVTHETMLIGTWRADAAVEPILVVAPALRVGGRVVESDGRPVRGGSVRVRFPAELMARIERRVDRTSATNWQTEVAADGRFSFSVPQVEGARLCFTATACAAAEEELPLASTETLHVVLAKGPPTFVALRGRLLAPDGSPAFGAFVTMGAACAVADRDGQFALDFGNAGRPTAIVAAMPGLLPVRHELPANSGAALRDWPEGIVMQFGTEAGTVVGRVVDDAGPVADAEVWLDDPTPFGGPVVDRRPLQIEYVIGGAPMRSAAWDAGILVGASTSAAAAERERAGGRGAWVHEEQPTAAWQFSRTDRDGRFVVTGLLPRAYRLRAFDRRTGRFGEAADVVAGSEPTLVLPDRATGRVLRGRVVSAGGQPIAGAMVQQKFELFRGEVAPEGLAGTFLVLRDGPLARTAKDGSFVLRDVFPRSTFLMVDGEQVMPTRVEGLDLLVVEDPADAPLLRVDRRCPVEVQLADPGEADEAVFVDAGRRMMFVGLQMANDKHQANVTPLHDGRSGPLVVGERSVACVLLRGKAFVREVPIAPSPERPTIVQ